MADIGSSNDITVGTTGDVLVESESVRLALNAINRVADELLAERRRLVSMADQTEAVPLAHLAPPAQVAVRRSVDDMRSAARVLASAEARARRIHRAVLECLADYEAAERVAGFVWHALGRRLAWLAGADARLLAVPAALVATGAAVDWLAFSEVTGVSGTQVTKGLARFMEQHPRILSNPVSVTVIGGMVNNADEFGEGFLGIPEPIGDVLGARGLGVLGVPSSARVVEKLGNVIGLLKETEVSVDETGSWTLPTSDAGDSALVRTLNQRAHHFISADKEPDGEQVRIEKYSEPGKPDRFEVYVAGTVTFNPIAQAEPFDMTSNISGVGHASPGAYRAVIEAMRQAGVTRTSPVVLNGYSQGGLIASLVASSNRYNVKGLVTFGAPAGQIPVAADIPTLTVRHTEDLVPQLGGSEVNEHAVIVYRSVFDDRDPPDGLPVAGHAFGFYKQTAAIIDGSQNPELRGVLDPIDHFEDGATTVTTTMFRSYRREPGGSVP